MLNYYVKNKKISINPDNDMVGSGGQGKVYIVNGVVYKIALNENTLMAEGKIAELQELQDINEVVPPIDHIYDDKGVRCGYTMKHIVDTYDLNKLITDDFCLVNNISIQDKLDKMANMMVTTSMIHSRGVIITDYNEMNMLTQYKGDTVFFIDTDSWSTKNYKGEAIMHSVRDRRLPLGEFDAMSDWFSFAVITFMMLTSVHPYRGRHLDYKRLEYSTRRMDDMVSVFNKDVKHDADFSIIPSNMLGWYKMMFETKDRYAAPLPGAIGSVYVAQNIKKETKDFLVDKVIITDGTIHFVQWHHGTMYICSSDGIYVGANKVSNERVTGLIFCGDEYKAIDIETPHFYRNKCVYTIEGFDLMQYSAVKLREIRKVSDAVSMVNPATAKLYDGCVVQDIYDKYSVIIPFSAESGCVTMKIPELNRVRTVDAKSVGQWLFIIYELSGQYNFISIYFNKEFDSYQIVSTESDVSCRGVNAAIKENGVVILNKEDDDLELFQTPTQSIRMAQTPVSSTKKLYAYNDTYFTSGNTLYQLKSK